LIEKDEGNGVFTGEKSAAFVPTAVWPLITRTQRAFVISQQSAERLFHEEYPEIVQDINASWRLPLKGQEISPCCRIPHPL
jgi:hypothetical protein